MGRLRTAGKMALLGLLYLLAWAGVFLAFRHHSVEATIRPLAAVAVVLPFLAGVVSGRPLRLGLAQSMAGALLVPGLMSLAVAWQTLGPGGTGGLEDDAWTDFWRLAGRSALHSLALGAVSLPVGWWVARRSEPARTVPPRR